ncbi:hypothetical protein [Oryza sativa Japonica Group]|uniref:Uncharacterized protein n=1 Tax=Oryza sativa subsp. japonica TaxID=39947 RepID=Q5N7D9_ORYSJ|nr:hypothetical protein [Oryza sativa Japonica Group]BAD82617.1 hypothetical protein [Oryza sativa Japonica Group]
MAVKMVFSDSAQNSGHADAPDVDLGTILPLEHLQCDVRQNQLMQGRRPSQATPTCPIAAATSSALLPPSSPGGSVLGLVGAVISGEGLGVYGLPPVLRGRPIKGARAAGRHVPPFSSQCRSSATTRRRVTAEPRALRSTPPVAISRPDPTEGAGFLRPHHRHGNRPLALRRADTIAERFGELSPPQQRSHARSLYRGDE